METFKRLLWKAFLLSLPVTSFRYIPADIGGGAKVFPLAMYPLVLLFVVSTLPALFRRPLPSLFLPFLAFSLVALIGLAVAGVEPQPPLFGVTQSSRALRSLITVGVGGLFFTTVALYPRAQEELYAALKWLYAGFGVALLWSSLQLVYVLNFNEDYYQFLNNVQKLFSIRKLHETRVTGLAFEPNWFAEQILLLYFPWLLASALTGRSAFSRRLGRLSLEWVLLGWGTVVLVFTFSRAGIVVLVALAFLSVLMFPSWRHSRAGPGGFFGKSLGSRLALGLLAAAFILALVLTAGSQNRYFSRLWRYFSEEETTGKYWDYIAFGQRFLYWQAAFRMFETHPLLGVGLGNYAFYLNDALPEQPLFVYPEVLQYIVPEEGRTALVTPKGLFPRLLAETGVAGMAVFLSFLIALAGRTFYLLTSPPGQARFWGIGGFLGLAAFFLFSFSTDSFALPNMWIVFGLITAAFHLEAGQSAGESGQEGLSGSGARMSH